ncbi:MAG: MarR family transcriptional regulator [Eggerthellaceae bacterium]|jgi:DNA-binding MarR family transcriptional regulator
MSRESVEEKFQIMMSLMHRAHHRGGGRFADPSRGQGRIIALLKLHDGVSTKQLASILGVRISSLNETLAKLEAAGLIERRPSEQDGRIMLSYLTEAGRQAAPDEEAQADPLADFSDDDLAALEALLTRMIGNVEKTVGADAVRVEEERAAERRGMIDAFERGEWDGRGEGPRSGRGGHHGPRGHEDGAPGHHGPRGSEHEARGPRTGKGHQEEDASRGPRGDHRRGGYARH